MYLFYISRFSMREKRKLNLKRNYKNITHLTVYQQNKQKISQITPHTNIAKIILIFDFLTIPRKKSPISW